MKLKGAYLSGTAYNVGDVVLYTDGVVYHLQKAAPAGTVPTDSLYWGQLEKTLSEAVSLMIDAISMAEADADTAVKAMIENNLTTTAEGKILDARQGKALKTLVDACLTASDITDGLTSEATDKALSANQGKVLKTALDNVNPNSKTIRLASSTAESDKIFDITVDDDGELTATEYTPPVPEE